MRRRSLLLAGAGSCLAVRPAAAQAALEPALLELALQQAAGFDRLRTLLVARDGELLVSRVQSGPPADRPANVKSVSKTLLSALVGIAIDKGVLQGTDQRIAALLPDRLPPDPDPRLRTVTVGHLLSMQAGLERTSGANYGRWVSSRDWVRFALSRPFVDEPGGRMLYSTGSYHLLSAALTRAAGRSTLELARAWLAEPLEISLPAWPRDPQGVYFGGNDMLVSPMGLLRFGEAYRLGGTLDGRQVIPPAWIAASWTPRAASPFTGDAYGYGWFLTSARGHPVRYGWGYGGQMLWVVPSLALTAVATSDPAHPSGRDGYARALHGLVLGPLLESAERARPA